MFACAVFLFSSLAVLFYAFIASLQSSSAAIHVIVPLLHSFNYVWDVITYGYCRWFCCYAAVSFAAVLASNVCVLLYCFAADSPCYSIALFLCESIIFYCSCVKSYVSLWCHVAVLRC